MQRINKNNVSVYDAGSKQIDRYTVRVNGSWFAMNDCPEHPLSGICQFLGHDTDGYQEGEHLGDRLDYLPAGVIQGLNKYGYEVTP